MTEKTLAARHDTAVLVPAGFLAVYLLWGSTYLAIRVGIQSFPPLLLGAARYVILGLPLYLFCRARGATRPTRTEWRDCAISGLLLFCTGNGLLCLAETRVPTGIAALLVATVSFWMVLADWLRPGGMRPSPRVCFGLVLGLAGLALLVGPAHLGGSRRVDPLGAGMLVTSALSWALGSVYAKHRGFPGSPLLTNAMQSLAGGLGLVAAGFLFGETRGFHPAAVTLPSWLALTYLMLFGSLAGFSAYLYILRHSTAAHVGTYAFVNPVVALLLGWLFLGEEITLRTLLATGVILTAVVVVITASNARSELGEAALPAGGEG